MNNLGSKLEKKTFRSFYSDGIMDMAFGSMLIVFAINALLTIKGIEEPFILRILVVPIVLILALFKTFYTLLPEGRYHIDLNKVKKAYLLTPRRKKGEPFTQVHKDIAAALQETLEDIVMHILEYYKQEYDYKITAEDFVLPHNDDTLKQ